MTRQIRRPTLLAAALGVIASAGAIGQEPSDSVAKFTAQGRKLFEGKGLCFSCHGKDGEGILAPSTRLVGRALVHVKPTVAEVSALIKSGVDSAHSKSGQVMPARGGSRLTDTEVNAVAWYVLDLQKREKPH